MVPIIELNSKKHSVFIEVVKHSKVFACLTLRSLTII